MKYIRIIGIVLLLAACGESPNAACIYEPDPDADREVIVAAVAGPNGSWVLAAETGEAFIMFTDPRLWAELAEGELVLLPLNEGARNILFEGATDVPEGDPLYRGLNASNTPIAEAVACAAVGN